MSRRKALLKLTAEDFSKWRIAGADGKWFDGILNQAVAEIVGEGLVEEELECGLRAWLEHSVRSFFNHHHHRKKETLCADFISDLASLHGIQMSDLDRLEDPLFFGERRATAYDLTELKATLSKSLKLDEWRSADRKDNAAKPALKQLARDIHCFWATGWTTALEDVRTPTVESGARYVQFAGYVFKLVDHGCGERMLRERLVSAEKEVIDPSYRNVRLHLAHLVARNTREALWFSPHVETTAYVRRAQQKPRYPQFCLCVVRKKALDQARLRTLAAIGRPISMADLISVIEETRAPSPWTTSCK